MAADSREVPNRRQKLSIISQQSQITPQGRITSLTGMRPGSLVENQTEWHAGSEKQSRSGKRRAKPWTETRGPIVSATSMTRSCSLQRHLAESGIQFDKDRMQDAVETSLNKKLVVYKWIIVFNLIILTNEYFQENVLWCCELWNRLYSSDCQS